MARENGGGKRIIHSESYCAIVREKEKEKQLDD